MAAVEALSNASGLLACYVNPPTRCVFRMGCFYVCIPMMDAGVADLSALRVLW